MLAFFIFPFEKHRWFRRLSELNLHLENMDSASAPGSYASLFRELANHDHSDLAAAFADALISESSNLSRAVLRNDIPIGIKEASLNDLDTLLNIIKRDWQTETETLTDSKLPSLQNLAPSKNYFGFEGKDAKSIYQEITELYKNDGTGILAKYPAFKYFEGKITGIDAPQTNQLGQLIKLEKQITSLHDNTSAFINGFKAQHTLLYGPRGSGKSTAVRCLLDAFRTDGLRMVELAAVELASLPDLVLELRTSPHRFIVFVDDLSFESGDTSYQPLKSILEGSLAAQPENVLIYATSNRRHLIKEQFSDRPDPLNDDVHRWDTQHEKLALSDRFGLTITFPNPSQKRYLEIVMGLATQEKLESDDLRQRAIRYADWGNGYSGRTAQQFIDSVKAGLA